MKRHEFEKLDDIKEELISISQDLSSQIDSLEELNDEGEDSVREVSLRDFDLYSGEYAEADKIMTLRGRKSLHDFVDKLISTKEETLYEITDGFINQVNRGLTLSPDDINVLIRTIEVRMVRQFNTILQGD